MTGSRGIPLVTKLGIRPATTLALLEVPDGLVGDLPPEVAVRTRAQGRADVVVACFVERARFEARVERLGAMVFPAGGLWIAWPKRASGVTTDMNEDVVREVALPLGLVDNKVCAIDETWSGLRMVWRRERRG